MVQYVNIMQLYTCVCLFQKCSFIICNLRSHHILYVLSNLRKEGEPFLILRVTEKYLAQIVNIDYGPQLVVTVALLQFRWMAFSTRHKTFSVHFPYV